MKNTIDFSEFPQISDKAWKQQIQVDLKGGDYNELLTWTSPEGIVVKPFYSAEDLPVSDKKSTDFPSVSGALGTPWMRAPQSPYPSWRITWKTESKPYGYRSTVKMWKTSPVSQIWMPPSSGMPSLWIRNLRMSSKPLQLPLPKFWSIPSTPWQKAEIGLQMKKWILKLQVLPGRKGYRLPCLFTQTSIRTQGRTEFRNWLMPWPTVLNTWKKQMRTTG